MADDETRKKYDITVLTLIDEGGSKRVGDQITFYEVGESVREFLALSCRDTLFKLMKFPEDTSPNAWNLKYRTVVTDARTKRQISDTKLITFPSMSRQHMVEFQRWGIQQLSETVDAIEADRGDAAAPKVRKRNSALALVKLFLSRSKTIM